MQSWDFLGGSLDAYKKARHAHWHEGELGSGAILNQENRPDIWEVATHDVFTEPLWKIACNPQ